MEQAVEDCGKFNALLVSVPLLHDPVTLFHLLSGDNTLLPITTLGL